MLPVRKQTDPQQDWPPSSSFEHVSKQNFDAFMHAVPMPSYTRYDGFGNLIAHYGVPPHPYKSLKPDVGTNIRLNPLTVPNRSSLALSLSL